MIEVRVWVLLDFLKFKSNLHRLVVVVTVVDLIRWYPSTSIPELSSKTIWNRLLFDQDLNLGSILIAKCGFTIYYTVYLIHSRLIIYHLTWRNYPICNPVEPFHDPLCFCDTRVEYVFILLTWTRWLSICPRTRWLFFDYHKLLNSNLFVFQKFFFWFSQSIDSFYLLCMTCCHGAIFLLFIWLLCFSFLAFNFVVLL